MRAYLIFRLGDYLFAIPAEEVEEVVCAQDVTSVYGSPDFVAGLFNLRGRIVTALDLSRRFGIENKETGQHVILRRGGEFYSLMCAAACNVVAVAREGITPVPFSVDVAIGADVSGLFRWFDNVILILETDRLFSDFKIKKETA